MKLYIPTCTLNFNNIFATASISPKIFYSKRGFGNKRYYEVEPNNLENVVTLYSRIPVFRIETDIENYPIIIEIDTIDYNDDQFKLVASHNDINIYVCGKTIYFNPFHTRVIFFDYEAYQSTLTKAQQSLENKFANLYRNNLIVKRFPQKSNWFKEVLTRNDDKDYFNWDNSYRLSEEVESASDYTNDAIIDRIRGFAYCYLIGEQLSVSPEVGKLKSLSRRMRNTLSAIVNSPGRRPTDIQDKSITSYIREFNEIYSKIDDVTNANERIINSKIRGTEELGISKEQIIQCLKLNGVFDAFCKMLNLRKAYNAYDLMSCLESYSPEQYDRVNRDLQNAVSHVEVISRRNVVRRTYPELITVSDLKIAINEDYNKQFYEALINSQIKGEYIALMQQNGITDNEALGLAYNGGAILKRIMGPKWDNSPVSVYVNNLLSHLQSDNAFELFSTTSEVLASFAAFCQKGDNIDRLVEYLTQLGFSNYKLAYGIYGATRGFASLPKTFTKVLIDGDKHYFANFVCSIYKQIFGIDLSNADYPEDNPTVATVESKIGTTLLQRIDQVESKPKQQDRIIQAVAETAKLESAVQNPRAFMFIIDSFPGFKKTKAYQKLQEADFENDQNQYDLESFRQRIYDIIGPKDLRTQQAKIDKAIELESLRDNPEAFLMILDNFLKPKDKAYKTIQKLLETNFSNLSQGNVSSLKPIKNKEVSRHSSMGKNEQPTIPGFGSEDLQPENEPLRINPNKSIIYDDSAIMHIQSCQAISGYYSSKIVNMFMDFQKSYRTGYYYQNPQQYHRNNSDVIDHFCKWCLSDKNKKHIERNPETSKMMDNLKSYLLSFYPDN